MRKGISARSSYFDGGVKKFYLDCHLSSPIEILKSRLSLPLLCLTIRTPMVVSHVLIQSDMKGSIEVFLLEFLPDEILFILGVSTPTTGYCSKTFKE